MAKECDQCGTVLPNQATTQKAEDIPVSRQILAFMHCHLCMVEKRKPDIEAGWTQLGFQVWCRNHNVNILHVDFEGHKHPANATIANSKDVS